MIDASEKELVVRDGWRCKHVLAKLVDVQNRWFSFRLHDRDLAVIRGEIDTIAVGDQGGAEVSAKTFTPQVFARFGIEAMGDSTIIGYEQQFIGIDR